MVRGTARRPSGVRACGGDANTLGLGGKK
jgi:hypothetical protein